MRIKQQTSFAIVSSTLSAAAIADRIGVAADQSLVRGSRIEDPPIPKLHWWKVVCDEPDLSISEQVTVVLRRIRPAEQAIVDLLLTLGSETFCVLSIVRYFDHPDGTPEETDPPPGAQLQKLPGQHQLLGWGLDEDTIGLLARLGASLDVDEYSADPFAESGPPVWAPAVTQRRKQPTD